MGWLKAGLMTQPRCPGNSHGLALALAQLLGAWGQYKRSMVNALLVGMHGLQSPKRPYALQHATRGATHRSSCQPHRRPCLSGAALVAPGDAVQGGASLHSRRAASREMEMGCRWSSLYAHRRPFSQPQVLNLESCGDVIAGMGGGCDRTETRR